MSLVSFENFERLRDILLYFPNSNFDFFVNLMENIETPVVNLIKRSTIGNSDANVVMTGKLSILTL